MSYASDTIKWLKDVKDPATRRALTELFANQANGIQLNLRGLMVDGQAMTAGAEELTVSGAVTPGVQSIELNHTTVAIAATVADASKHPGLFVVKATAQAAVGQEHTLTLTSGTFDGTSTVATLADVNDALAVYFDGNGNGTILANVGVVVLT